MKKLYTLVLFLISLTVANSQSGALDTSFGTDGIVTTVISGTYNYTTGTLVQPDGKIILVGYAGEPSTYKVAVARYNTDGSLDTSFGTAGTQIIPIGAAKSFAMDVALQMDGKIILAARTWDDVTGDFAVVRLNDNGTLDTNFGTNGITIVNNGSDVAETVAIQNDGKIILAGFSDDTYSAARFNTDGTLDTSFGTNGWASTQFDTSLSFVRDIAIQDDGKILMGGFNITMANRFEMSAARFNEDGTLDTSFGTDGKVWFNIGAGNDFAESVAIQDDGKILIGGHKWISDLEQRHDLAVVRLNSDGTFDNSYGSSGVATARLVDGSNYTAAMILQPDNKVVLAGSTVFQGEYNMAMARFDADGILDTSFDTDGMVSTDINGREDYGDAITLQEDGKIILAGNSFTGGVSEIVVARFDNDILGLNDSTVNENQIVGFYNSDSKTFNVQSETETIKKVSIFTISGQGLATIDNNALSFSTDVSAFAEGIYIVIITTNNNRSNAIKFLKY